MFRLLVNALLAKQTIFSAKHLSAHILDSHRRVSKAAKPRNHHKTRRVRELTNKYIDILLVIHVLQRQIISDLFLTRATEINFLIDRFNFLSLLLLIKSFTWPAKGT